MENNSFVFHQSYWEAIDNLPNDLNKCNLIKSICEYMFYSNEPTLEGIEKSIWLLIKPTLDASSKRYKASVENGKKGGRPKKTQEKPNNNLTETNRLKQVKPNQNLNIDKDKDIDKNKDTNTDTNTNTDIIEEYMKNKRILV